MSPRVQYPGMKPIETKILNDFYRYKPHWKNYARYNVRLFIKDLEVQEDATQQQRDHWARLRAKRIDVMFTFPAKVVVVEVAENADEAKVDQALRYARIELGQRRDNKKVSAGVVCRYATRDVIRYAHTNNVWVVEVPDVQEEALQLLEDEDSREGTSYGDASK